MMDEKLKLQKHTLNLYEGEFDELKTLFPAVEPSVLVRELVHDCIKNAKANDPQVKVEGVEVKL